MRLEAKTPVWAIPARWTTLSMISAISPRGEVAFQMVEGGIDADRFIAFLAALIQDAPKKIYLVVDNLRVHHAKVVTAWLADKKDRIELAFLPPYTPESNPDEYLNRDFKTALRTGAVSTDKNSLLAKATAFMQKPAPNAAQGHPLFSAPRCSLRHVGYLRAGLITGYAVYTKFRTPSNAQIFFV